MALKLAGEHLSELGEKFKHVFLGALLAQIFYEDVCSRIMIEVLTLSRQSYLSIFEEGIVLLF